jgi:regulator of RNase E activity RraA
MLERKEGVRDESVRPRSPQSLGGARNADKGNAIESLFVGDTGLVSLLNISASEKPGLMDNICYLCQNNVKINLSRKESREFEKNVQELLAETPLTLKCVLSDEGNREKPSLYVKEGAGNQSHEIVYASGRKDMIPLDDLAFAINFISQWQKNNQVWPVVYAYFQPPKAVPPELISAIDEASISHLRNRNDVCDLSDVGFKPFHGEDAPGKVAARVITIKAAQCDNKSVANAIKGQTQPGDVVVLDAGGHSATATVGGIVGSFTAKNRGIKALLVYGEVRDQVELKALSIPVFSLGCSPNGPSKAGPGSAHCSLNIGNIPFKSGDIIKIDGNQIVVVSIENAISILKSGGLKEEGRAEQEASSTRGSGYSRKTFELTGEASHKNRARPETPAFIPQLFKEFAPAQLSDSGSFIKPEHLWGAGSDLALRMGAIPDGVTLVGEAVLSRGSEESIISALSKAKKGDFLIISGESDAKMTAAVMGKIHEAGISCIVIDGKEIVDEDLRRKYNIPCFAREKGAADGSVQKKGQDESRSLERVELSDGFTIKPGYVMMADADGIAGFSPTKFSLLYRTAFKRNLQEKATEERNKSPNAYQLPQGSIVTDRYYEPFAHACIDQFPLLPTFRGIASMTLPAIPTEVQVGNAGQRVKLGSDETLNGVPEKITTHGQDPMTFTLRNEEGEIQEVEGVAGRALFEVALAAERKERIEVRGDGSIVRQ